MTEQLSIGEQRIKPGNRSRVRVPVTVDLDDNEIALTVHIVSGANPGKTLALLATLHGEDWQNIEVIRRTLDRLNPQAMQGNVIAVPVSNPLALARLSRITPDGSDTPDLNRVFPGTHTTINDQLAALIVREVMAPADALIDFHSGMWGATHGMVIQSTGLPNAETTTACAAMARAFGWPSINETPYVPELSSRTATGYFAGTLGRPCITPEIGGSGFDRELEEKWIEVKCQGIINVLKHLDILEGEPETAEKYLVWQRHWRVNPSKGGFLMPELGPERLNTEVSKGELLGTVLSPYSLEAIEQLRAPGRGVIYYCGRPYPVRPGNWAYGVVDLEDENTRWE